MRTWQVWSYLPPDVQVPMGPEDVGVMKLG
jgi:hypothetical protein